MSQIYSLTQTAGSGILYHIKEKAKTYADHTQEDFEKTLKKLLKHQTDTLSHLKTMFHKSQKYGSLAPNDFSSDYL